MLSRVPKHSFIGNCVYCGHCAPCVKGDVYKRQIIEHEATVSKVSEDQLFYLMSRGLTKQQATEMIVMGFIEPFSRELPMEYAVELNQLIKLDMGEDSIG